MTAIVLPDIDKATIDELRKKLPDLREIELPALPKMENVSKTADETINRLLGRQRAPVWPWVAAGIGLVAVIGAIAAYFAWWRRPTWETPSEPWAASTTQDDLAVSTQPSDLEAESVGAGLTAAEASLTSTEYSSRDA